MIGRGCLPSWGACYSSATAAGSLAPCCVIWPKRITSVSINCPSTICGDSLWGLYWAGRFLTLPFLNQWIGGFYLAALLTLSAYFTDKALNLSCRWKGVGFVPAALLLCWASWRGYNLYLRNEPSLLIIGAWLLLIVSGVAAAVRGVFGRKDFATECPISGRAGACGWLSQPWEA